MFSLRTIVCIIVIHCTWFNRVAYSLLDCYQCNDIQNITDCHLFTQCNADEYCYTETTGMGLYTRFTLGCRSKHTCLTQTSSTATTSSSLSIVGRSVNATTECSQCCAVDVCNKQLCTTGTHALGTSQCEDDPTFDCPRVSSIFNICSDTHHAKLNCKKFCGLCDIADGHWSGWGFWSRCSVTCGPGTRSRARSCDNPAPRDGGLDCVGERGQTTACNMRACPVHGAWSRWSPWGTCSVTCGIGLARRDRSCSNPYPGPDGDPCYGDSRDDRACFIKACADGVWSVWSSWSPCSASCLGGIRYKTRTCTNPQPSLLGHDCVGNSEEFQACNTRYCTETDGGWSVWSGWTSCSESSNFLKKRTRVCNNPRPSLHGQNCAGTDEQMESCVMSFMTSYVWSSWSTWGSCSMPCNGGLQTRRRTCAHPSSAALAHNCVGNSDDFRACNMTVCPGTPAPIRLVNGSSNLSGRLEIYHTNWGTVCDDAFDTNDANVVCRMLGIETVRPYVKPQAYFGKGTLPIMLDDVNCNGSETDISKCSHPDWGTNNCGHGEDVGVVCAPPIRLVNGSNSHSGRLEVKYEGGWGTVCDNHFDTNATQVVCRSLGYSTAHANFTSRSGGTLPILLDDVICKGTEHSLEECKHRAWRTHNCSHSEDVYVTCA